MISVVRILKALTAGMIPFALSACLQDAKLKLSATDETSSTSSDVATTFSMSSPVVNVLSNDFTPLINGTYPTNGHTIYFYKEPTCSAPGQIGTSSVVANTVFSSIGVTFNGAGADDGLRIIYYKAHDGTSFVNTCTSTGLSYTLDTTPPNIVITSAPNYANTSNYTSYGTVSGNCSENGNTVTIKFNGTTVATPTCNISTFTTTGIDTSSFSDGAINITAIITDNALNTTVSAGYVITKDTVPPGLVIVAPTSGSYINQANVSTYSMSGSCSAGSSNVTLRVDWNVVALASVPCSAGSWLASPLNMSSYSQGSHTLSAEYSDSAGNQSITSLSVIKDTLAPSLSIGSPAPSSYINLSNVGTYLIDGTCSDGTGNVTIKVDGVTLTTATCSATWSTTQNMNAYGQGGRTISAEYFDIAGNISTVSVIVTKDTFAPTLVSNSPSVAANPTVAASMTYTASFSESVNFILANISTTVGGATSVSPGPSTSFTFTYTLPSSGTGTYTITIDNAFTDLAGNPGIGGNTGKTYYRNTPTISYGGGNPTTNTMPTLNVGNIISSVNTNIYSDSSCLTAKSAAVVSAGTNQNVTVDAPNALSTWGSYTYYSKVTDTSGYQSLCSAAPAIVQFDNAGPTFPSITAGNANTTNVRYGIPVTFNSASETGFSSISQFCVTETASCGSCVWNAYTGSNKFDLNLTTGGSYGIKTVYAQLKDALGNVSTCQSYSVNYNQISVVPTFGSSSKWLSWVKTSDYATPCDGSETTDLACIHVGGMRKVVLETDNCAGITASDSLGAFDNECKIQSGKATVFFTRRPDTGVGSLINSTPAWYTGSVTITSSAPAWTETSNPASAWWDDALMLASGWTNSVVLTAGTPTIYIVNSSMMPDGININSNNIGIVVRSGFELKLKAAPVTTFNGGTGESSLADTKGLISSGGNNFLWFEGRFSGNAVTSAYGMYFVGTKFSILSRASVYSATVSGISLTNTIGNLITGSKIAYGGSYGIYIDQGGYNRIMSTAINNNTYGISMSTTSNNRVVNSVIVSNQTAGIYQSGGSANTFLANTVANTNGNGMYLSGIGSDNIIHNALFNKNGATGNDTSIYFSSSALSTGTVFDQIASRPNIAGNRSIYYNMNSGGTLRLGGNLVRTNSNGCFNGFNSTYDDTCTGVAAISTYSNVNIVTSAGDFANEIFGQVVVDDTGNVSDTTGSATYSPSMDMIGFSDFLMRAWGLSGTIGKCTSGTCYIWDYGLLNSAAYIRNKTDTPGSAANTAFPTTNGNPCPGAVTGDKVLFLAGACSKSQFTNGTDCGLNGGSWDSGYQNPYLENAIECIEDIVGDNDGLCESNENCMYTPNFGAYQGHGTVYSCSYNQNGGLISNVKMLGFGTNGK